MQHPAILQTDRIIASYVNNYNPYWHVDYVWNGVPDSWGQLGEIADLIKKVDIIRLDGA
jgi:hypothetical protein